MTVPHDVPSRSSARIHELIPKIADQVGVVPKDRKNPEFGYHFQGIDDILARLKRALHDAGVFYFPRAVDHPLNMVSQVTSKSGTAGWHVVVAYEWVIVGPGGDQLQPSPVVIGQAIDYGDKAFRKAQTSSKKSMLIDLLNIAASEHLDTDGDPAHTIEPSRQRGRVRRARDGEPFCPGCWLSFDGARIGVRQLPGGKGPMWKCEADARCGASVEKDGKTYGWAGWNNHWRSSVEAWIESERLVDDAARKLMVEVAGVEGPVDQEGEPEDDNSDD